MSKKILISLAAAISPFCLALGSLAAPEIARLLLGVNLLGVPINLVLIGVVFIAGVALNVLQPMDSLGALVIN